MQRTINNTNIFYEVYGSGKTVYFLHGLGINSQSMIKTYEPLLTNQNIRRVYIDLPGMGKSIVEQGLSSSDDILQIIEKFIQLDSKDEVISLVGHSYGGYLCLGLAYSLNKKVEQLFLTCPVIKANLNHRTIGVHKNILHTKFYVSLNEAYYDDFLSMNVVINDNTWNKYQEMIVPGLKQFNNIFWEKLQGNDYDKYSFLFEEELIQDNNFKGIILLGKNDHIVGYKDQLNLLNNKNNIEIAVLNHAGHNLFIDAPQDIEYYLNKFITQI